MNEFDVIPENALLWRIDKRHGDWSHKDVLAGLAPEPYETVEGTGNLLTYGGASLLWHCVIGSGTATSGQATTYLDSSNASLGVATGTTPAIGDTDLGGASKFRKLASVSHTDGTSSTNAAVTFATTYATGEANFAWGSWGMFNTGNTQTGGRMLNAKAFSVVNTKASGSWTLTVTLTLG